jgi:ATP-dependent DNA ligase
MIAASAIGAGGKPSATCDMMLEGLASKRCDSRYRAGPSRDWIKVKNPKSPAMNRAKDAFS